MIGLLMHQRAALQQAIFVERPVGGLSVIAEGRLEAPGWKI